MGRKHYGVRTFRNDDGYTLKDWALAMAGWYLERWWGFGNIVGNRGLYEWHPGADTNTHSTKFEPVLHFWNLALKDNASKVDTN